MSSRRNALPASQAEYLEWSRRWEAARLRAGWAPMVALAAGVLGGMALQRLVLQDLVPRPWPSLGAFAVMIAGGGVWAWMKSRNDNRVLAALGRMCGDCEQIIHDSRAVVRNGGRCTHCGGQLFTPGA